MLLRLFLLLFSFPADIDDTILGIRVRVEIFVTGTQKFRGLLFMKPDDARLRENHRAGYKVDYEVYPLPFPPETKPVIKGTLGVLPYPSSEVAVDFTRFEDVAIHNTNLAKGPHVLEVEFLSLTHGVKQRRPYFFQVKGTYSCKLSLARTPIVL